MVSPPSSFHGRVSTHRNRKEARCPPVASGQREGGKGGCTSGGEAEGRGGSSGLPGLCGGLVVRRFLYRRYTSLLLSGHSVHYLFSSCFLLPLFFDISDGRGRGAIRKKNIARGGEALYNNIDDFMNFHHPERESLIVYPDIRVPDDDRPFGRAMQGCPKQAPTDVQVLAPRGLGNGVCPFGVFGQGSC